MSDKDIQDAFSYSLNTLHSTVGYVILESDQPTPMAAQMRNDNSPV